MRAIIFIDRNSLYYYGGSINKKPVSLAIPDTILQDIEVIDDVAFKKLLFQFIKKYSIKPSSLIICFSSKSYFTKEIKPQKEAEDIPQMLAEFAEIVPFNHVLAKIFIYQKKQTIIALNRDIAYLIRDIFESRGFKVEGIIPAYALFGDKPQQFSLQLAQFIIKHFSSFHEVSFPIKTAEQNFNEPEDKEFSGGEKQKKNNIFVLLGVFVLLTLVLIYMFFFYPSSTPTTSNAVETKPSLMPTKAALSTTPTATPSVNINKDAIKIRILNGSGIAGQAGSIQDALETADFKNITLGNAPTQSADKTLIIIKSNISKKIQNEIQDILTDLNFESRIRTNNDIDADILITTYQIPTLSNQ